MNEDEIRQDEQEEGIICELYIRNFDDECSICGQSLEEDEVYYEPGSDDPLCCDCYNERLRDQAIRDYSYKPEPVFYGKGTRFFGVELEIDEGGETNKNAQTILRIANRNADHAYCKHDGSLDDGFEIVTHPMTLDYQLHTMPWADVVKEAAILGYTSHQARTCGLHIHVNRDCFGEDREEQEAAIARVLYFFEKHWEELLKFSRRTPRQLDRWAARYGYHDDPKKILDTAKKSYGHAGRYTCVNLTNDDTVEFRIFRGTLKLNTLIATLQFIDRICDVAICLNDEELTALPWTTFVSGTDAIRYPELIQYLKERRLYVNDVVDAGGEI